MTKNNAGDCSPVTLNSFLNKNVYYASWMLSEHSGSVHTLGHPLQIKTAICATKQRHRIVQLIEPSLSPRMRCWSAYVLTSLVHCCTNNGRANFRLPISPDPHRWQHRRQELAPQIFHRWQVRWGKYAHLIPLSLSLLSVI